jgi:uncharacterized protein DUF4180
MTAPRQFLAASEAGIAIRTPGDISNAIASTAGYGGLLLTEADLSPEFFNLKSGLAGELFQKFTNYQLRLVLIVTDPQRYGEPFRDLAREHRTHNHIRIVPSRDEAEAVLF